LDLPEPLADLAALQHDYLPTASELLDIDALTDAIAYFSQDNTLTKAINPALSPYPSAASKAGKDGMQSVYLDDFNLARGGDYWLRPSGISFDALREIVLKTPVLNAVVMTRVRQVQRFCRISETNNTLPGFEIRHIDRKHALTPSEQDRINELQRFFTHCGDEPSARQRKRLKRDSFAQLMGKLTRDSLVLDSVAIETEWRNDKKLGMAGFYAVDGATIRLCPESGYRGNADIFAVQVVSGMTRTLYGVDDLIYEPRNARSDVTAADYGLPETELLIRVVTGFLNAMALNNNYFDKNTIPRGVMHLIGNYDQPSVESFKRYFTGLLRGVDNAFALPILASKDKESSASFEKFDVDVNEMMFAKWMTFLTSIICAIYGMSPSEINFDSFTGGNTSALSGNDTEQKLAASKDSGLRPLLAYFENTFTDYIVNETDPNFCFRWTGLDIENQQQKYELRKALLTVNELRAEEGYKKLEGGIGDAPVNPSLLNAWMQLQAEAAEDAGEQDNDSGDDELAKAFADESISLDSLLVKSEPLPILNESEGTPYF